MLSFNFNKEWYGKMCKPCQHNCVELWAKIVRLKMPGMKVTYDTSTNGEQANTKNDKEMNETNEKEVDGGEMDATGQSSESRTKKI